MMRELLPFTIALFAAGCSLTPDYQRPVAPVPAVWPADANQTVGGGATATAIDWRSVFTDPQLRGLIAGALEHNRDLRIAVGRVDEARALAGIASADRFPGIDLGAQRAASLTPGDLSATGRQLNAQRYDANLGVTAFELDFWGRVKSLDDAARASFLATDYARRAFRLSLIADVAGAWLSWLELDERAGLAADTAKSRGETRRLIDKRREVGLAGDLDFLAADGAWQSARADAASLARQRAVAANALRLLVGKEVELRGASLATLAPIADLPAGLPAEVLLARPDVLAAEQKLIATNANIGAARAAFLPKILLTAVAGTASRALSGLFDAGSGAWSFTPLLKLPLFDAGRSEGNLDLALARRNVAVADYEKTLQQAFREVADLLAARQYYAEQMTALGAAARAQGERMQRVEARYLAGVSGQLELLDAQREHQAAQQSALAARRSWLASAASLYKALSAGEE
jgi:multidrug efflux system outer membrane protein